MNLNHLLKFYIMFKFLKLMDLIVYFGNKISTSEITDDVEDVGKNLIIELSSIEEDFAKMELYFNKIYDEWIGIFKNEIDNMKDFLPKLRKKGIQKNEYESNIYVSDLPKLEHLSYIFDEIVFSHFLGFYDKRSYSINKRIMEIYKTTFSNIKNELKEFPDFKVVLFENEINLKNVEYRGFHYFLNKLEQKLADTFEFDITDTRTILYGYKSDDNESQTEVIQEYYNFILYYKYRSCASNIDNFFRDSISEGKLTIQEKAIKKFMSKHVYFLNKNTPYLYEYISYQRNCYNIYSIVFEEIKTFLQVEIDLIKKDTFHN